MGEHSHVFPHTRGNARRTIAVALAITVLMGVAEFVGGLLSNSLALQGDAAHMFMDTAALGIALASLSFLAREPRGRQTFGYHRAEVLGASVNGLLLVGIAGYVLWRAYERFLHPAPVQGPLMLGIAVLGLAANGVALALVHRQQGTSLGARGAFLHILSDAVTSVATIVAGVLVWAYGLHLADPIIALLIVAFILRGAFGLLRESGRILMEAAPKGLGETEVRGLLLSEPGVEGVHDVHVWGLTAGVLAVSAHVEVRHDAFADAVDCKERAKERLHDAGFAHVVLELDVPGSTPDTAMRAQGSMATNSEGAANRHGHDHSRAFRHRREHAEAG